MHLQLLFCILVLLGTGCAADKSGLQQASGTSGHTLAQQLADKYVANVSPEPPPSQREEMREDFIRSFFDGFTGPEDSLVSAPDAAKAGFDAGQRFRRDSKSADIERTMHDYGYTHTEAEGTWITGFETSCFHPLSRPEEKWWLNGFGNTRYVLPKETGSSTGLVVYHVVGFLSPKGQYGHLGGYDRELYATKVSYRKAS